MVDKSATKKPTKPVKDIKVTLIPNNEMQPSRIYSNYVHITQTPYDFSLKFCDATPISVDSNTKNQITHNIPIVAEIAIPLNLMPKLIKALQTQYEDYKNQINKKG